MVASRTNFGLAIRSNTILPTLQKPKQNGITTSVEAIFPTAPCRIYKIMITQLKKNP